MTLVDLGLLEEVIVLQRALALDPSLTEALRQPLVKAEAGEGG